MDGGNCLPSSVHVIDCACLLKQYLRSLPEPLLFSEVHARVVASMDLEPETRIEAMALSILLLPRTHIDTLLYLIDVSPHSPDSSSYVQDHQTISKHLILYLIYDRKE